MEDDYKISEENALRPIDPALFAVPTARELRDAALREAGRRVGDVYTERFGDGPFTVVTMMAAAQTSPELLAALRVVAPDRYGLGSLSRNMLTRWFTAQEFGYVPAARFRIIKVGAGVWRYVPVDETQNHAAA